LGAKNRTVEGIVVEITEQDLPARELKSITKVSDAAPLITPELIELARFMSSHYFCGLHQALACVMPSGARRSKLVKYVRMASAEIGEAKLSVNQARVVEILRNIPQMKLADLSAVNSSFASAARTLAKRGIIEIFEGEEGRGAYDVRKFPATHPLKLTSEQSAALEAINTATKPILLHGVTGSGKTEVFLQAIARVIGEGRQAIVLVPEISLTPQIVERFVGRFGERVSVLHSGLSDGERFDEWRRILRGEVDVAVGARSAVFAPFSRLGIIIIDEEQEGAYKSEHTPKFTAHEVAKWRAERNGATLALASATPSIGSFYAAQQGEYQLVTIEKRHNAAPLPRVEIVDMRLQLAQGNKSMFSGFLEKELRANLERGEQSILFLNRRGYHTFVSCRSCGEAVKCPHCSVTLTYHKRLGRLLCHYCDYSQPNVEVCPSCGSPYVRYFGDGTQRLEAEIERLFPGASYIRMDMDTTGAKNAHEMILTEFKEKGIDILVGTQMVTKGLDFENVTLVGVMAADLSLNVSDFRAFERTFSQLTQVCGRAGRGGKTGRAVIQTYEPDHFVIKLAKNHNYPAFYESEIAMRMRFTNPPMCDIIMILASGADNKELKNALKTALKMLGGRLNVVPPAPAPISKIKGLYRWRTLVKCAATAEIRAKLAMISEHFKTSKKVSVSIDINPNSML
jgi:primosomal protein N' (replication factor Y)